MPAKRTRRDTKKEYDRIDIVRRFLQGETQEAIAQSYGVTRQQIAKDIKAARRRWQEEQSALFEEHLSQKITELELVKNEAWQAWQASKGTKEVVVKQVIEQDGTVIRKTSIKKETLTGSASYLSEVVKCIREEATLLNLPTELKYQDINTAIAKVLGAGFEVREHDTPLGATVTEDVDAED